MNIFKWQNENCQKCNLYKYSLNPKIKGKGNNVNPKIVLIGEAPGPDEAKQGIPFIGRAGRKLDQLIKEALDDNSVFITNMVKCFPPISTINPEKGFRVPKEIEIEHCKPFLIEELDSFSNNPILMSLGNTALFGLIGKNNGITKEAGLRRKITINNKVYNLVPNFHPSLIVRNSNYTEQFRNIFLKLYEEIR